MTLSVAFLWHLHQPTYRDPLTGRWLLPWVRLHALKDYYDMVAILEEVPGIALNFNFSPCLISQLSAYARGDVEEVFAEIAYKPASSLTNEERAFLLRAGFQANPRTMIESHARYRELYLKRGRRLEMNLGEAIARFTEGDLRDLQVWSQLAWFDPWVASRDPDLRALLHKEEGYSEEDKLLLRKKEQGLVTQILPMFREALARGRIEITASPYYHPILPLLTDTDAARECRPEANLPNRFRHPEDASWHLEKAVDALELAFGQRPTGLWPSEGAVSEEVIPLASQAGFQWLATDEGILRQSLGAESVRPEELYAPWSLEKGDMTILFRDTTLSDRIGFEYSRWPTKEAVEDFLEHLRGIQQRTAGKIEAPLVLVALDGENAWEYYSSDGREFLLALYQALAQEPDLQTVRITDYLRAHHPARSQRKLSKLYSGSWIDHDFSTWIGSEAHLKAWNLLGEARNALSEASWSGEAWESLYAAEGSDWFWWYSERHLSTNLEEFDLLFRNHVIKAYEAVGLPPPPQVYETIAPPGKGAGGRPEREPSAAIHPILDGKITDYYEWQGSGRYDLRRGGVMPYPRGLLTELLYGADAANLYLGLSLVRLRPEEKERLEITLEGIEPKSLQLPLVRSGQILAPCKGAFGKILEMAIPLSVLNLVRGKNLTFFLILTLDEEERYPGEPATIRPFDEDQDEAQWMA